MLTMNVTSISTGMDEVTIEGTITPSGNYVAGGDTIDFTTIQGAQVYTRIFTPQALPTYGSIQGNSGDVYAFVLGTALNNCKAKIWSGQAAPIVELGAGAYPARITGDTNIYFAFSFPRLL